SDRVAKATCMIPRVILGRIFGCSGLCLAMTAQTEAMLPPCAGAGNEGSGGRPAGDGCQFRAVIATDGCVTGAIRNAADFADFFEGVGSRRPYAGARSVSVPSGSCH